MTQEEKELLLKDLCARLPYQTKVLYNGNVETLSTLHIFDMTHIKLLFLDLKPYLRPISSMTDEEIDRLFDILHIDKGGKDEEWVKINDVLGIEFFFPNGRWVEDVAEVYDYLNSIHIDYRGLISKGVALKAPENMYNYE